MKKKIFVITGSRAEYGLLQGLIKRFYDSEDFDLKGGSTLGINTSRIFLGSITHDADSTGAGVYMDTGGAFRLFGNSTNYITVDAGSMALGSDVFTLATSTMELNSGARNGYISLGANPPQNASGSTGFYADGNGTFMIGNSSGNRLQYLADGTIYMKSSVFTLDTNTLKIDSAANDGKIALGASPNTSVAGTSRGVYMDGFGDFLVYGDADNFFRFDVSSELVIRAENFDLDAGTIVMDSELASGTLRLGESGGPTSNAAGQGRAGIYMDGTGDLLISDGDAGDNEGYLKFDSSGTFELQTPALTFETDGTITSQDYLIEKTRIFGSGGDGDAVLSTGGSTPITSDDDGSNLFKL